jgi:hypothetical protein
LVLYGVTPLRTVGHRWGRSTALAASQIVEVGAKHFSGPMNESAMGTKAATVLPQLGFGE